MINQPLVSNAGFDRAIPSIHRIRIQRRGPENFVAWACIAHKSLTICSSIVLNRARHFTRITFGCGSAALGAMQARGLSQSQGCGKVAESEEKYDDI